MIRKKRENQSNKGELARGFEPFIKSIAIGITIVYATGFLIVSLFLDRFNIIGAGVEFLKVKYIQVGLLFSIFPCLILAPLFIFFYLRNHPKTIGKMPMISMFNIWNLLFLCYWFATFASQGLFYKKGIFIASLFIWTVFWVAWGRRLENSGTSNSPLIDTITEMIVDPVFNGNKCLANYRKDLIRFILIIGIVILDFLVGKEIGLIALLSFADIFLLLCLWRLVTLSAIGYASIDDLGRKFLDPILSKISLILRAVICFTILVGVGSSEFVVIRTINYDWNPAKHAFFYYLFCLLALTSIWREHKRIPVRYRSEVQPAAWFMGFCIVAGLYYMGILAFAYGVYPHIPVVKGGGNYVNTPDVELYWEKKSLQTLPTFLLASSCSFKSYSGVKSVRLKIIEETPNVVFVANPRDPDPEGVKVWEIWRTPQVVALRRDAIMAIVHFTSTTRVNQPPQLNSRTQHTYTLSSPIVKKPPTQKP